MARIQPIALSKRSLLVRFGNWFVRRRFGHEMDQLNILAHSPSMVLPMMMASQIPNAKTQLSKETGALATHLVAVQNGCAWCIDFGLAQAVESGLSLDKLLAAPGYADDPQFTAAERAAFAYAETITAGTGHVPDQIFDALRPHFSQREIVELTTLIAIENFFNRVNGPLGIESQHFCVMPTPVPHGATALTPLRTGTGQ